MRIRSIVMSDSLFDSIVHMRTSEYEDQKRATSEGGIGAGERRKESYEPFSDGLELLGIIDRDVDAEVHALLRQVHIETGDLGASDAGFHGWETREEKGREKGVTRIVAKLPLIGIAHLDSRPCS